MVEEFEDLGKRRSLWLKINSEVVSIVIILTILSHRKRGRFKYIEVK